MQFDISCLPACLSVAELTNINRICDVPTLSKHISGYDTDMIIQAGVEGRKCCAAETIHAAVRADHPLLHYHPQTVQQRHCVVELVEGAVHRYMSLGLHVPIIINSSLLCISLYPHLISPRYYDFIQLSFVSVHGHD